MSASNTPSEREWLEGLRYEDKFPLDAVCPYCAYLGRPCSTHEPRDDISYADWWWVAFKAYRSLGLSEDIASAKATQKALG